MSEAKDGELLRFTAGTFQLVPENAKGLNNILGMQARLKGDPTASISQLSEGSNEVWILKVSNELQIADLRDVSVYNADGQKVVLAHYDKPRDEGGGHKLLLWLGLAAGAGFMLRSKT